MRVSSMIAANALLAKNPWNRLRPSLVQSSFAKEMRGRSDVPDNVLEALQVGDKWYDDAVLLTSRHVNHRILQKQLQQQQQQSSSTSSNTRNRLGGSGDAVYTPSLLEEYDQLVWGFNCPFLWRIHMEEVKGLYNDCMLRSRNHAEVGVGTGLFLRELNVPDALTDVVLIDSNSNSLEACQASLLSHPHYEYSQVKFRTLQGDILQPPPYELRDKFDSVGANFLLHCLGGGTRTCSEAIENLAAMLHPHRGTLFGTTILGQSILEDADKAGPAALETLHAYNDAGIFGNLNHSYRDVSRILHDTFDDVEIWRAGYCAVFKCRGRRR
jgi:Methyltransferase domain